MVWSNAASAMFDRTRAFASQFTPVEGGYLYYPSRKDGGKFVSVEEYDRLLSGWRRVAGMQASLITVGLLFFTMMCWTIVSVVLALPDWTSWIGIAGCAGAVMGWLFQASSAPRRLVKDRPNAVPPRPLSQARRQARAAISWPLVILVLFSSAAIFLGLLSSTDRAPDWWAWVIGSGLMFASYVWIGLEKLRDRQC